MLQVSQKTKSNPVTNSAQKDFFKMPEVTRLKSSKSARSTKSAMTTVKRDIRIVGENGLTMLKCSRLVELVSAFTGQITIFNGVISVD